MPLLSGPCLNILTRSDLQVDRKFSKLVMALQILSISAPTVEKNILEGMLLHLYGKRTIWKL